MYCSKCGTKAIDGAAFCQKCGAKLIPDNAKGQELVSVSKQESPAISIETVQGPAAKTVKASASPTEPVVSSGDELSDFYSNEAIFRNKKSYGSTIKPYYCEQFNKIDSGEKTKFNWAAFLVGGYNMLYNGCNKLFCMTFLPLSVVGIIGQLLNTLGEASFDFALINISLIINVMVLLCNLVLSIVNGLKFNTWYYQDVTRNPEKRRNRKGLWIYLVSTSVASIAICAIPYVVTPSYENLYDDSYENPYKNSSEEFSNEDLPNIELSEIYTNEKEGFSFRHPLSWQHLSETDFAIRKEMLGGDSLILEIYSLDDLEYGESYYASYMQVLKAPVNLTFQGTIDDFQRDLSERMDDVEVIGLSDIELDGFPARKLSYLFNDNGQTCAVIEYYYVIDDIMYVIRFYTFQGYFNKYEPLFNAIMDTYTITATDAVEEDIVPYDVYDQEAALQNMLDWFERHPLQHNIRIRFMEEAVDGGNGSGKYLKYELDMAEELDTAYELYGSFYVNPDNGDMVMESTTGGWERIKSVQVPMDQWYLEYYWGWTDDSGYYTESYNESSYTIYDDMDYELLEYHGEDDTYVICNSDTVYFIEYDGSPTASEISIDDFTGLYLCDQSFEMEGQYVGNEYLLDIGKVEYNSFSITESWRGIDFLQDDYAQPRMLIENTLYFTIYNSESGCYETHYLTYTPAQNSPLGKDMVYLDGDDSMPFEKE